MTRVSYIVFVIISACSLSFAQSDSLRTQSIGLNLYATSNFERLADQDYDYERINGSMVSFSLDYAKQVRSDMSMLYSVGYSRSEILYQNNQNIFGSDAEDLIYHKKNKIAEYGRVSLGVIYWFGPFEKAAYAKAELIGNYLVAAQSNEEKRVGEEPFTFFETEYKSTLKTFYPTTKIGVGYKLLLTKKLGVQIGFFADLRWRGSAFKESEGAYPFSRGIEMVASYTF